MTVFDDHLKFVDRVSDFAQEQRGQPQQRKMDIAQAYPPLESLLRRPVWTPLQAALILAGIDPGTPHYEVGTAPWDDKACDIKLLTGEIWVRQNPWEGERFFHPNCGLTEEQHGELMHFFLPWAYGCEPEEPEDLGEKCSRLVRWQKELVQRAEDALACAVCLFPVVERAFDGTLLTPPRAIAWALGQGHRPEWLTATARQELHVLMDSSLVRLDAALKRLRQRTVIAPGEPRGPNLGAPAQAGETRKEIGKPTTQERYLRWYTEYLKLKQQHPEASDSWCAERIFNMKIGNGKTAAYIRRTISDFKRDDRSVKASHGSHNKST